MHTCNALQARSCWLSVSACLLLVCAQEIADAQKGTKEAAANYTSPDATAEEQHTRCAEEAGELVDHFKRRMLTLLDWRNTSKLRNGRDADTSYEVNMSSPLTVVPEHSRGGFACVILDREYKIAYRLEPMQNAVDAAAWLAPALAWHAARQACGGAHDTHDGPHDGYRRARWAPDWAKSAGARSADA